MVTLCTGVMLDLFNENGMASHALVVLRWEGLDVLEMCLPRRAPFHRLVVRVQVGVILDLQCRW